MDRSRSVNSLFLVRDGATISVRRGLQSPSSNHRHGFSSSASGYRNFRDGHYSCVEPCDHSYSLFHRARQPRSTGYVHYCAEHDSISTSQDTYSEMEHYAEGPCSTSRYHRIQNSSAQSTNHCRRSSNLFHQSVYPPSSPIGRLPTTQQISTRYNAMLPFSLEQIYIDDHAPESDSGIQEQVDILQARLNSLDMVYGHARRASTHANAEATMPRMPPGFSQRPRPPYYEEDRARHPRMIERPGRSPMWTHNPTNSRQSYLVEERHPDNYEMYEEMDRLDRYHDTRRNRRTSHRHMH